MLDGATPNQPRMIAGSDGKHKTTRARRAHEVTFTFTDIGGSMKRWERDRGFAACAHAVTAGAITIETTRVRIQNLFDFDRPHLHRRRAPAADLVAT